MSFMDKLYTTWCYLKGISTKSVFIVEYDKSYSKETIEKGLALTALSKRYGELPVSVRFKAHFEDWSKEKFLRYITQ